MRQAKLLRIPIIDSDIDDRGSPPQQPLRLLTRLLPMTLNCPRGTVLASCWWCASKVGQGPIRGPCPAFLHRFESTVPRGAGVPENQHCGGTGSATSRGCAGESHIDLLCLHLSYRLSGMHQDPLLSGVLHTVPFDSSPEETFVAGTLSPPGGRWQEREEGGGGVFRCVKQGRHRHRQLMI